jgi:hypothetical protein
MNWIDVNEDLPPKGADCLVYAKLTSGRNPSYLIMEGIFDPSTGWRNEKFDLEVLCWCCPENLRPPENFITRLTLERHPTVCETLDDSQ